MQIVAKIQNFPRNFDQIIHMTILSDSSKWMNELNHSGWQGAVLLFAGFQEQDKSNDEGRQRETTRILIRHLFGD